MSKLTDFEHAQRHKLGNHELEKDFLNSGSVWKFLLTFLKLFSYQHFPSHCLKWISFYTFFSDSGIVKNILQFYGCFFNSIEMSQFSPEFCRIMPPNVKDVKHSLKPEKYYQQICNRLCNIFTKLFIKICPNTYRLLSSKPEKTATHLASIVMQASLEEIQSFGTRFQKLLVLEAAWHEHITHTYSTKINFSMGNYFT